MQDVSRQAVSPFFPNTYGKDSESMYQDYMDLDSILPDDVEKKIQGIYALMDIG